MFRHHVHWVQAAAITLTILPITVFAHPFSYTAVNLKLVFEDTNAHVTISVPHPLKLSVADDLQSWKRYFYGRITLFNDEKFCPFTLDSYTVDAGSHNTTFTGTLSCPNELSSIKHVRLNVSMFNDLFEEFDIYTRVEDSAGKHDIIFKKYLHNFPEEVGYTDTSTLGEFFATTAQFIWLGMLHIWTGYDHVLFLLSIVLLLTSLRVALIYVSTFTVAHSITLLLAGFHIVSVPSAIVEPTIAFTILLAAAANIYEIRRGKKHIPVETHAGIIFALGLVHGLGFASALAEAYIPPDFFVSSLISFNVGVELGQVVILAILLPVLLQIRKQRTHAHIFMWISGMTAVIATFWLVTRLFGV
jgi:hypothetical protein